MGKAIRSNHCSFCGKGQERVRRLIAGPGVYICDECIALCNSILADGRGRPPGGEAQPRLPTWRARRWLHILGSPLRVRRGRRRAWQHCATV